MHGEKQQVMPIGKGESVRSATGHPPPRRLHGRLYLTAVVAVSLLFATQPIQPVFQREFMLSGGQAVLFTTVMMLPLGGAPLFYGYLLELVPARTVLRSSLLLLALLSLAFALAGGYFPLLVIRGMQGLVIPAVLISLMSYLSCMSPPHQAQQAVAVYVGMTVVGGICGRLISGISAELFGWQYVFVLLALLLAWCWSLVGAVDKTTRLSFARPRAHEIMSLFRPGPLLWIYLSIFLIFFSGTAVLNFVPFELKRILPHAGESMSGLLYLGNSMGILVALANARIRRWCGGETNAVLGGLVIFMFGTAAFLVGHYLAMFCAMFVLCLGMFATHATLSGYVGTLEQTHKPVANGLYLSFYYFGGALGSIVPVLVYEPFGWRWLILALLVVQIGAVGLLCLLRGSIR